MRNMRLAGKRKRISVGGKNFDLGEKIGEGSFGQVRVGQNLDTKQSVAIKVESTEGRQTLTIEYKLYKLLGEHEGVPKIYLFASYRNYNLLIMELLGPSLQKCFENNEKKFSLKTVIQLGVQILHRIELVHSRGIIYRDIKPENFLLGLPGSSVANLVHIIDFGLAKLYMDQRTRMHIPYTENKHPVGTARYMSLRTHLGHEISRRDDLESIGHMLIYFLRGSLPWQGLVIKRKEDKYKIIYEKKASVTIEQLCQDLPEEFAKYLKYTRELSFEQTPNYDYLRSIFVQLFEEQKFPHDGLYDWDKAKPKAITKIETNTQSMVATKHSTNVYCKSSSGTEVQPLTGPSNKIPKVVNTKQKRMAK